MRRQPTPTTNAARWRASSRRCTPICRRTATSSGHAGGLAARAATPGRDPCARSPKAIPAIVVVVDAEGRYRFVNSAFEHWYGTPRERIIGCTLPQVLGPLEYEKTREWSDRALAGETVHFERRYQHADGIQNLAISYIPLLLDNGQADGFVGVSQDITHHRQEQGRLRQLAQRDGLTGLVNRAGFEEHLERCLDDGEGDGLALLYIDLDHFKPVNDEFGHPVGDRVLQDFAARLRDAVRPTDVSARLGGDEFAVVLKGVRDLANANRVADKIVAAARAPFEVDGKTLHIGASVGVAFGIQPGTGWRDLVSHADTLLYEAKRAGRGQRASALH
jgi:diguanylate cyclase (GGDEF)-like protein/PAS domain S-box-containing protein